MIADGRVLAVARVTALMVSILVLEGFIANGHEVVVVCVVSKSEISFGHVVGAARVGVKRLKAIGRVEGTARVIVERGKAVGRVLGAGRIGKERIDAVGCVFVATRIVKDLRCLPVHIGQITELSACNNVVVYLRSQWPKPQNRGQRPCRLDQGDVYSNLFKLNLLTPNQNTFCNTGNKFLSHGRQTTHLSEANL